MKILLRELAVGLDDAEHPEDALRRLVAERVNVKPADLHEVVPLKRALDARRRRPQFVFTVMADAPQGPASAAVRKNRAEVYAPLPITQWQLRSPPPGPPPVVIGAGPAGLFAALTLARAGWPPVLIERGAPVEERTRFVSKLYAHGELNPESNVCFGEGGAGAYSDGKLYTRVNDPRVEAFLGTLVELGANPDIKINTRPHIGTDKLVVLLQNLRAELLRLGCTVRFNTRVEQLDIREHRLHAVVLAGGERLEVGPTVLATGHSAREIMEELHRRGVPLEARPFAVGFRVEHPQTLIDDIRYGSFSGHPALPAADYKLTYNEGDGDDRRGVYSFCMCPGGVVVTTPTRPGELCINGMSHASRSGRYANSALVVTVHPGDYAQAGHPGLFGGVRFQEEAEQRAFAAGGGNFTAPASSVTAFLQGKVTTQLGPTSYRRGLSSADLSTLYPAPVIRALRRALPQFNARMRGFVTEEAKLIGVETRTASPLRLPRGDDMQAVGVAGLYPAGEGLGYGGGIASAAVDGVRAAEAILQAAGAAALQT